MTNINSSYAQKQVKHKLIIIMAKFVFNYYLYLAIFAFSLKSTVSFGQNTKNTISYTTQEHLKILVRTNIINFYSLTAKLTSRYPNNFYSSPEEYNMINRTVLGFEKIEEEILFLFESDSVVVPDILFQIGSNKSIKNYIEDVQSTQVTQGADVTFQVDSIFLSDIYHETDTIDYTMDAFIQGQFIFLSLRKVFNHQIKIRIQKNKKGLPSLRAKIVECNKLEESYARVSSVDRENFYDLHRDTELVKPFNTNKHKSTIVNRSIKINNYTNINELNYNDLSLPDSIYMLIQNQDTLLIGEKTTIKIGKSIDTEVKFGTQSDVIIDSLALVLLADNLRAISSTFMLKIEIHGHTQKGGKNSTKENALSLSIDRAKAVRKLLEGRGVIANYNIIGHGYSQEIPGKDNKKVDIQVFLQQ